MFPSGDELLKHHLLKMLVTDLLPLTTVKDIGFRAFSRALNPTFDPPSSALWVRTELLSVYEGIKTDVRKTLESVPEVALTAEMWTHASDGVYLTVSCHFIDRYWKRRSCVLETAPLGLDRDAGRVAEQLLKTANEWGVATKVKVVVSNTVSRGSMTESCEAKGWTHVRCFVCTLDVVFREALALLDNEPSWRASSLLRKCRAVVRFFQQDRDAQRQLRANQEQLKISPLRLVQATQEDSWQDVGAMLQRLAEQRDAINMVLLQHIKEDLWLNDRDAEKINIMLSALQPLRNMAKEVMVSDGYESLSNIIPIIKKLQKSMAQLSEDGNQVARALADVFVRHFTHVCDNRWMALSTMLDPRFKNIMQFSSRAQAIEHKLQAELKALCPSKDTSEFGTGADEVDTTLKEYKSMVVRDQNPLDFWRLPRRVKKLSVIAHKYLTVVSTAVPLHRAFNPDISRKFHHSRCHLEPENVNLMMFLNGHWSIESSSSPESD